MSTNKYCYKVETKSFSYCLVAVSYSIPNKETYNTYMKTIKINFILAIKISVEIVLLLLDSYILEIFQNSFFCFDDNSIILSKSSDSHLVILFKMVRRSLNQKT